MDMDEDSHVPVTMGRPLLATIGAMIDVLEVRHLSNLVGRGLIYVSFTKSPSTSYFSSYSYSCF